LKDSAPQRAFLLFYFFEAAGHVGATLPPTVGLRIIVEAAMLMLMLMLMLLAY
jgi:hypothetical protein